jgi:hypothetical protein
MKNVLSAVIGFATLMSFLLPTIARADVNAAANKVREGIADFRNRDFKAAIKAFEAAESDAPEELRLAFNRGCAFAAAGDADKAIEQFQRSAVADDKRLAALSEYNLGCVAAGRAIAKLGAKPEEAEGDVRTQSLDAIAVASAHFRDTLSIDSRDEDARYNLETLRAWSRYIQAVWKARDRQRQLEKLDLLDYLRLLETEQRGLRAKAKQLHSVVQDSPRKRQDVRKAAQAQQELAGEVGALKHKIGGLAAGQGRGPGAPSALPPDAAKAIEVLSSLADQIGSSMQMAADRLSANAPADAIVPQTSAIENLDQVFSAVAPYANLVQRGIDREEDLIDGKADSARETKDANANSTGSENDAKPDFADAAWNQQFIVRYGKIIPFKAKQEINQLETQPATGTPPSDNAQPKTEDAQKDDALKAEEQRRELKQSLQLGVELAPKVEQLAHEAADLLSQEKADDALPKQQEALKLLKEMLPKQQQQEQQKKDQEKQDQKNQEKKEQNKKEDQKKDQEKKDQNKKDEQKKDQQENDKEKKKEQDKENQEKKDNRKQEEDKESAVKPGQKKDMPTEQAEELLRRVQVRQEQHKQMQKELEGYLYRPEKVEKDW